MALMTGPFGYGKRCIARADEMRIAFVGIGRDDSRAVAVARPTANIL